MSQVAPQEHRPPEPPHSGPTLEDVAARYSEGFPGELAQFRAFIAMNLCCHAGAPEAWAPRCAAVLLFLNGYGPEPDSDCFGQNPCQREVLLRAMKDIPSARQLNVDQLTARAAALGALLGINPLPPEDRQ